MYPMFTIIRLLPSRLEKKIEREQRSKVKGQALKGSNIAHLLIFVCGSLGNFTVIPLNSYIIQLYSYTMGVNDK